MQARPTPQGGDPKGESGNLERSIVRQGLLARFWQFLNRMLGRRDSPWDQALRLANREAARFNHEYIGTEHLLLGLLGVRGGMTSAVLENLGIDPDRVRLQVEKLVQRGPDMVTVGRLPLTPRSRNVIDHAQEEARRLGHAEAGTEELLLGLLREEQGVAAQVLLQQGLTMESARREVLRVLGW